MHRAPGSFSRSSRTHVALSPSSLSSALLWSLTSALCLLAACASAEMPTGWVCFDGRTISPASPHLEFISSSAQELVLEVKTPGVVSTAEFDGQDEYRRLELPDYYRTTEVGYPEIPAVRQLIAIPAGCSIGIDVSVPDTTRFSGSTVYPAPDYVVAYTENDYPYLQEEFACDEQAYGRSTLYPGEIARIDSVGMLRGQGVALLTVFPIQHAAASGEIEAYPSVTVTLTFTGGFGGVAEDIGPFTSIARSVMPNYDGIDWPFAGRRTLAATPGARMWIPARQ